MYEGTSQTYLEGLVFFFAHLEEHWKGRHSSRECVAEKVMLPCVGCVDVLESNPDLVQVSLAMSVISLAQQFNLSTSLAG